jgi:hypothetical protein
VEAIMGPIVAGGTDVSPIAAVFPRRLARLLRQEAFWEARVGADDWRLRLIRKAIYSTYCDCLALGRADEARSLLRQWRRARGGLACLSEARGGAGR